MIYPGKLTAAPSFRIGCIGHLGAREIEGALAAIRGDARRDGRRERRAGRLGRLIRPHPGTTDMSQIFDFSYGRSYRGPVQAVLLDWAGTTMDFGCIAPAVVFVEVFERQGVPISLAEAREPMGAHKRVHIEKITRLDAVRRPLAGDPRPAARATTTSRRCSRPSCRCSSNASRPTPS